MRKGDTLWTIVWTAIWIAALIPPAYGVTVLLQWLIVALRLR